MNNLPSLYELAEEFRADAEQLADMDLDEQTIADTLEGMRFPVEQKCTSVAAFIGNLDAAANMLEEFAKGKLEQARKMKARSDHLRDYLLANMQRCGISKIEGPYLRLSLQNNPPSVVIDDEKALPSKFMVTPEPPPPRPDKKAIGERLKAGESVAGAHLETKQRLVIK